MKHKIISVSHAKAKLLELIRKVHEEGQAFLLTKDGEPIGALVPMEEYEALQETVDVMSDSVTLKALDFALEDEKKGKMWRRDQQGRWTKVKRKTKVA